MTIHLYGIPNCDSVRKACDWLAGHGVAFTFHDFRKEGVHAGWLAQWSTALGWETLLNRRSTTWKQLPESDRENVDAPHAIALMLNHPTLIKRPVLECRGRLLVGFCPDSYTGLLTA
ncbi:MAG TPA: arsenate reductase [Mariprofundaceae bacterium]|nr:arsenate reductase [Mariprofundaceae bacterium]